MAIRKLKFFANLDREEAWLNQMAAEGQLLTRARTLYTFEPVNHESAVVRVDYRPSMKRADFEDYVRLFDDSGWRHLDGTRNGGPQYFASFSDDTNADIFSDPASKAQRYLRSITACGLILLPFLSVVFTLSAQGNLWPNASSSPADWYLTPGLWDMRGADFLGAFLFETIFVAFRVGGPLLILGFCFYLVSLMMYQYMLYRRSATCKAV